LQTSVTADFLIVGSGIAGLRAAVALAPHGRVVILTKADPAAGSTGYAQGGVAAAVGPDDSPELHARDTIAAGDGLCNEAAVRILVTEGPRYVRELMSWGAAFDREPGGSLALAREGAHSVRRVLHARDATGREIGRALAARATGHPNVSVVDHALAVGALIDKGRVTGVRYLDAGGRLAVASARAVLLATGGAGRVFRDTTNPPVATGDGIALGYLAGARVADLEFVQFHPTVLDVPGAPRHLLSEALRGEGARLVNDAGERFMSRYDPAGDLAPRDRVARAIILEQRRTGRPVFLSLAHLPASNVREGFPALVALCRQAGLDLATDRIPIGPAAHYMMGGVATDAEGRTTLPGLFAAGEVAWTGVHGANRLASNSLLEGLVFGARAGDAMGEWNGGAWPHDAGTPIEAPPPSGSACAIPLGEADVQDLMWRSAGVFRDRVGLEAARDRLEPAWQSIDDGLSRGHSLGPAGWRLASIVTVARLIVRAALRREESRGAHSRTDFPERDDLNWRRSISEVRSSNFEVRS
jgi:L-aspartate oxidase